MKEHFKHLNEYAVGYETIKIKILVFTIFELYHKNNTFYSNISSVDMLYKTNDPYTTILNRLTFWNIKLIKLLFLDTSPLRLHPLFLIVLNLTTRSLPQTQTSSPAKRRSKAIRKINLQRSLITATHVTQIPSIAHDPLGTECKRVGGSRVFGWKGWCFCWQIISTKLRKRIRVISFPLYGWITRELLSEQIELRIFTLYPCDLEWVLGKKKWYVGIIYF